MLPTYMLKLVNISQILFRFNPDEPPPAPGARLNVNRCDPFVIDFYQDQRTCEYTQGIELWNPKRSLEVRAAAFGHAYYDKQVKRDVPSSHRAVKPLYQDIVAHLRRFVDEILAMAATPLFGAPDAPVKTPWGANARLALARPRKLELIFHPGSMPPETSHDPARDVPFPNGEPVLDPLTQLTTAVNGELSPDRTALPFLILTRFFSGDPHFWLGMALVFVAVFDQPLADGEDAERECGNFLPSLTVRSVARMGSLLLRLSGHSFDMMPQMTPRDPAF